MIIVITSTGENENAPVCPQFGRAPFFIFYNTETKEYSPKSNPGYSQSNGAGPAAASFAINNGARVVITGRVGDKAEDVLKKANMKMLFFKDEKLTVSEAVKLLQEENA
jgi:predicted Fe-Mo cluster-binding NifX family protein